jgi:hypothetical protein
LLDEKTYTEKEVEGIVNTMRDRIETLEALDCARVIMIETKQYPRFINRIDYIIKSIVGNQEQQNKDDTQIKEEVKKEEVIKKRQLP